MAVSYQTASSPVRKAAHFPQDPTQPQKAASVSPQRKYEHPQRIAAGDGIVKQEHKLTGSPTSPDESASQDYRPRTYEHLFLDPKEDAHQRTQEQGFLDRRLKELENALRTAVVDKLDDILNTLNEHLYEKFGPATATAAQDAVPTAERWGAHRDAGGLQYPTYKATIRRTGHPSQWSLHRRCRASRSTDFNQSLFEPVQKQLAAGWEKAFHRRLPHILQTFTQTGVELLQKFHDAVETRCLEQGNGTGRIIMLKNQLATYQSIINDVISATIASINEGQREIKREFTPVITQCMEPAYEHCQEERGTGCFKRMKGHMVEHVNSKKTSMFQQAWEQVRRSLDALISQVRDQMLDRVDDVYVNMRRDYMSVIGGKNVPQVQFSREERAVRRELDQAITDVDELFQGILDSELADLQLKHGSSQTEDGAGRSDGWDEGEESEERDRSEDAGASDAEMEEQYETAPDGDGMEVENEDETEGEL